MQQGVAFAVVETGAQVDGKPATVDEQLKERTNSVTDSKVGRRKCRRYDVRR